MRSVTAHAGVSGSGGTEDWGFSDAWRLCGKSGLSDLEKSGKILQGEGEINTP